MFQFQIKKKVVVWPGHCDWVGRLGIEQKSPIFFRFGGVCGVLVCVSHIYLYMRMYVCMLRMCMYIVILRVYAGAESVCIYVYMCVHVCV